MLSPEAGEEARFMNLKAATYPATGYPGPKFRILACHRGERSARRMCNST